MNARQEFEKRFPAQLTSDANEEKIKLSISGFMGQLSRQLRTICESIMPGNEIRTVHSIHAITGKLGKLGRTYVDQVPKEDAQEPGSNTQVKRYAELGRAFQMGIELGMGKAIQEAQREAIDALTAKSPVLSQVFQLGKEQGEIMKKIQDTVA